MEMIDNSTPINEIKVLDGNIIQVTVAKNQIVELETIKADFNHCKKICSDINHHLLLIAGEFSSITTEARDYAMKNTDWALSMSMVSNSLSHRIMFNYSIRFFAPKKMKMHKSKDEALSWISSLT